MEININCDLGESSKHFIQQKYDPLAVTANCKYSKYSLWLSMLEMNEIDGKN